MTVCLTHPVVSSVPAPCPLPGNGYTFRSDPMSDAVFFPADTVDWDGRLEPTRGAGGQFGVSGSNQRRGISFRSLGSRSGEVVYAGRAVRLTGGR